MVTEYSPITGKHKTTIRATTLAGKDVVTYGNHKKRKISRRRAKKNLVGTVVKSLEEDFPELRWHRVWLIYLTD